VIEDGWRQQAVDVDDKLEGWRLLPAGQQDSSQEAGEEHGQTFHTDFLQSSGGMLPEQAMDGGAGDTIALCQLAQALASLSVPQDSVVIQLQGLASDVPTL